MSSNALQYRHVLSVVFMLVKADPSRNWVKVSVEYWPRLVLLIGQARIYISFSPAFRAGRTAGSCTRGRLGGLGGVLSPNPPRALAPPCPPWRPEVHYTASRQLVKHRIYRGGKDRRKRTKPRTESKPRRAGRKRRDRQGTEKQPMEDKCTRPLHKSSGTQNDIL